MAGSVSVVLVRPVVASLPSAQHAAFWAATDLTPELVGDDDARISPAQFCVAWAELSRATGRGAIALDIASALPAGAFGIVEYVCRSAPTLGEALRQWVRYLNLLDDAVRVALEIDEDRAYLRVVRESEAPAPASHELCFALVALRLRELAAAPFRVTAVEFVHAGDAAHYRAWFGAPVTFGAPITQLVLPRTALAISLTSADPKLLKILTRAADELQAHTSEDPTLTAQVSRVLQDALRADEGHIEHVARRLGLTTRSLQRRLKDEKTSFNAVREHVRRELSRKYLAQQLSIPEISFLLGFSEPSAFFRAFKRWTGQTPVEARRAAAAGS
ncbi:MAG: AraC family transcriptional regulator [Kofleriaceae bacterium]|nr:AraC family transcriptional regulator [Kofleriaceae bacterium]